MNLIKIEPKLPLSSVGELRFESPRIVNSEPETLLNGIVELISECYFKCRFSIEPTELILTAKALIKEVNTDYKWVTLWELNFLFDQGYKNKYGDYMGLSVRTFCNWIDAYKEKDRAVQMEKRKVKKEVAVLEEITQ